MYQVELEIFINNESRSTSLENFTAPTTLPNFRKTKVLDEVTEVFSMQGDPTGSGYPLFKTLPESVRLLNLHQKFEENKKFTPIVSVGWNHPRNNSEEIFVASEARYLGKIGKSERFFNPKVDLLNVRKMQGVVKLEIDRLMFLELEFIYDHYLLGIMQLKEKRRIKLNELNYFDHPFFGVVTLVSPID